MGLFHHKDKKAAPGPAPQYFVMTDLNPAKQNEFRQKFNAQFARARNVTLTFGRIHPAVADEYVAKGPNDQFLTITRHDNHTEGYQQEIREAVRNAAKQLGGTTIGHPVRSEELLADLKLPH